VGPRGHFLARQHTRQHLREIWMPHLTRPRPSQGGEPVPDLRLRARAELNRILANHQPEPPSDAVRAELRSVLEAAEREL
ncbi:MAG: hypothetical protein PVG71_11555, partial [Anaerolineae bacterium]